MAPQRLLRQVHSLNLMRPLSMAVQRGNAVCISETAAFSSSVRSEVPCYSRYIYSVFRGIIIIIIF